MVQEPTPMLIPMGSTGDTMHEFEKKDLRQAFPASEGWRQTAMACSGTSSTIYTFSRDLWVGREKITVISMYSPIVRGDEIAGLRARYSNGALKQGLAIMVPAGCDLSAVPPDIRKITMSGFGYDAGKLVWRTKKKNAKNYARDLPVAEIPKNLKTA